MTTAAPSAQSGTSVLFGILCGAIAGTIASLVAFLAWAAVQSTQLRCDVRLALGDALVVGMIVAIVAGIWFGIDAARRGRGFIAALLLTTAFIVLLPTSTCGIAAIAIMRC